MNALTTTSIRRYSLVSLAQKAVDQAREVWMQASEKYQQNRTLENAIQAASTYTSFKKTETDYEKVRDDYQNRHRRIDGTDNTMKASMIDAGLL